MKRTPIATLAGVAVTVVLATSCAVSSGVLRTHVASATRHTKWQTWLKARNGPLWALNTGVKSALGAKGTLVIGSWPFFLVRDGASGRDIRHLRAEPPGTRPEAPTGFSAGTLIAVHGDGQRIAAAYGRHLVVFERGSDAPAVRVTLDGDPAGLRFFANGTQLAVMLFRHGGSWYFSELLDAKTGAVIATHGYAHSNWAYFGRGIVIAKAPFGSSGPTRTGYTVFDGRGNALSTWTFDGAKSVAFAPGGSLAAVVGNDGTLRLLERGGDDAQGLRTIWSDAGGKGKWKRVFAFADGGRLLFATRRDTDHGVRLLEVDVATGHSTVVVQSFWYDDVRIGPAGRWAKSGVYSVWNLDKGKPVPTSNGPVDWLFVQGNQVRFTSGYLPGPRALDATTGKLLPADRVKRKGDVTLMGDLDLQWIAGDERTSITEGYPNRVVLSEPPERGSVVLEKLRHAPAPRAVDVRNGCLTIYERKTVAGKREWDDGTCVPSPGPLDGYLVVSADGRWVLTSGLMPAVWDLDRRRVDTIFDLPNPRRGVELQALSADGRWAFAWQYLKHRERLLVAWRRGETKPVWTLPIGSIGVKAFALHPTRPEVAIALNDGRVLLVDRTGHSKVLLDLAPNLDLPTALQWHPDGRRLIVGTDRGAVLVSPDLDWPGPGSSRS